MSLADRWTLTHHLQIRLKSRLASSNVEQSKRGSMSVVGRLRTKAVRGTRVRNTRCRRTPDPSDKLLFSEEIIDESLGV
jgi:hypothetical protein